MKLGLRREQIFELESERTWSSSRGRTNRREVLGSGPINGIPLTEEL